MDSIVESVNFSILINFASNKISPQLKWRDGFDWRGGVIRNGIKRELKNEKKANNPKEANLLKLLVYDLMNRSSFPISVKLKP